MDGDASHFAYTTSDLSQTKPAIDLSVTVRLLHPLRSVRRVDEKKSIFASMLCVLRP